MLNDKFNKLTVHPIYKEFICVDTAIFRVTEKDTVLDDKGVFKIGCRNTGDYEATPWVDVELEAINCLAETRTVTYKIAYEVRDIEHVSFAHLRYMYNVNSPSEFTIDGMTDSLLGGDEFNIMAQFDDVDFTFNIPFDESYSYI